MRRTTAAMLVFGSILALAVAGCTSNAEILRQTTAQEVEAEPDASEGALLAYADAERATLPQIHAAFPGLYEGITVTASMRDSDGREGITPGTYAVIWYEYTYTDPVDYGATTAMLDSSASTLQQQCEAVVFPAMRAAGITAPLSAVYEYKSGTLGSIWSYACFENQMPPSIRHRP